jgi:glucose-6-phosphate isomerase
VSLEIAISSHPALDARAKPAYASNEASPVADCDPVKFLLENPYNWPIGWYRLPESRNELDRVKEYAAEINVKADNLLLLGIGGSALGNIALRASLNPPRANETVGNLKLHVLDNVDPHVTKAVLDRLNTARTYVNVITKSGGTLETMATFFVTLDYFSRKLFPEEVARRFICTTDLEKSLLKDIARKLGFRMLSVPADVGGRFSVLSSVGLLSAAATGVDVDALLDGALSMRERCVSSDPGDNPALKLAETLHYCGAELGYPMVVMMPYADSLYLWADWWRQLWAESLGKNCSMDGSLLAKPVGTTPIKALGSTDQHSQVQLYQEGPDDKVFIFLRVKEWSKGPGKMTVPDVAMDKFGYLNGKMFYSIIDAECRATQAALAEAGRICIEIAFERVDAHSVGEFIMLWMLATAYAGIRWNVNPFDQPGVEAGKLAAKRILMG